MRFRDIGILCFDFFLVPRRAEAYTQRLTSSIPCRAVPLIAVGVGVFVFAIVYYL